MLDDPDQPDPAAPRRFAGALGRLYASPPPVPPAVDEAILGAARAHFARVRRGRARLTWAAAAVSAVAAAVLISVRLAPHAAAPQVAALPAFDPTRHPVTILDAFALARQLRDGQHPDRSWDANHDGAVDARDVDAIAAMAVTLPADGAKGATP